MQSGKSRRTQIKEDFEIAVHDVTQGQWQAVMSYNASYFSRFGGGRSAVKSTSDEELKLFPVEMVSWDDVQEFLQKLNASSSAWSAASAALTRMPASPHRPDPLRRPC
jgi:formylglycine-generating enzyme required for sulfatase activity